ncbi:MAG: tRNA glutamyl-Q(34) synthetase GluQRS, partial [Acidobacteriota bacterium]|nr:tRNA glutamyl-Q(34) synthetase GluQRS [Acidobacteriota bacterium]
ERRRRTDAGERFALRLRAAGERVAWQDRLLGGRRGVVDDFVLVRADGVHAYPLAGVVDDAAQGIGEVVRGADLADSTPRQILLQRLLGLPTPSYAHVPLVLGPSGARLAKRDRGATLADRDQPVALTLGWLAHSLGLGAGREQLGSASALLDRFELTRIPLRSVKIE